MFPHPPKLLDTIHNKEMRNKGNQREAKTPTQVTQYHTQQGDEKQVTSAGGQDINNGKAQQKPQEKL